jgi:hypothetical protein
MPNQQTAAEKASETFCSNARQFFNMETALSMNLQEIQFTELMRLITEGQRDLALKQVEVGNPPLRIVQSGW